MRFMVEIDAGMEKANAIDAAGGPGAMLAKLGERFKPLPACCTFRPSHRPLFLAKSPSRMRTATRKTSYPGCPQSDQRSGR
jgi:hypothetical protein